MLEAAGNALSMILELHRIFYLFSGVVLGLIIGILPGVGGVAGIALLLPFTFGMDPYTAFAFLLGLASVMATSDTIPAVMFGVPGSQSAQATVLDGHKMARNGEAGRALSAAYSASMIGGVFAAAILALCIPVMRPIMLKVGSPELLAFSVFGISMVSVLSGNSPLRGLSLASLGVLLSMIGADPQGGEMRWTLDTIYLYDGLPLLPVALGLFALPELADFAIQRVVIAAKANGQITGGMGQGFKDTLRNSPLVLACSSLGTLIGALPGLGSSVVDWFAYGFASKVVPGAKKTFGTGDVRGVIAPEAANNANTAGALIPTIAFGVPGSASMAILLGAFIIQGLVPGPGMLNEHLDITYSMIWSVALANILGAGLCFLLSGQLAKLATLRYTLIIPVALILVYLGAFQGNRDWGDIYALLIFGLVGWVMKQLRWPRPPLILGFVLGGLIEQYMFISMGRYGTEWLTRPTVMIVFALSALIMIQPIFATLRARLKLRRTSPGFSMPRVALADLLPLALLLLTVVMVTVANGFAASARLGPMIVGVFCLVCLSLSLIVQIFTRPLRRADLVSAPGEGTNAGADEAIMEGGMDLVADHQGLSNGTVFLRGMLFFGWMLVIMALMALIGLLPAALVFIVLYMRVENRERWGLCAGMTIGTSLLIWLIFDHFLRIPWPPTLLGELLPAARIIPSI
ncbi:tripartite tricarboxylate transporter permease [Pseudochelatococcus sp. B33]